MPSTASARTSIAPAGYSYQLTGYGPITQDGAEQSEKDLQKAELVSLPIAALVLILVFASIVAAGMPLLVAGLAIPSTHGPHLHRRPAGRDEHLRAQHRDDARASRWPSTTRCSSSAATARNCGAAGPSAEAVERAVATSGKAVMFSGIAVAIGLSGLLLFEAPAIRSIGIAGSLVVISSVVLRPDLPAGGARDARPARQRACRSPASARALPPRRRPARRGRATSRWEHVALWVMRHPIKVMIPTLAILLIAGIPYGHMVQGVPGADVYPPGVESRDAYVALQTEFAPGETTPIVILADVEGSPTDAGHDHARSPSTAPSSMPSRASTGSRARSPSRIRPRARRSSPEEVAALYALEGDARPAELDILARPVRPREHGPARRHQPARRRRPPTATDMIPVVRAVDRRRGHHDPGRRRAPPAATTSSSRRPSERRTPSA